MTFESDSGWLSPSSGREPGVPLRGYGIAVQVALLLVAAVNAVEVPALLHRRALAREGAADPQSISLPAYRNADHAVSVLGTLELATLVIAAIAFLAWFYRARRNADGFATVTHRRARAWAFWGWFCPVVNFWFPYQIATDTLRASDRGRDPGWVPESYLLIKLWWAAFVVAGIFDRLVVASHPDNLKSFATHDGFLAVASILTIVAAALAVLVVGRISGSNDRFRQSILAAA
jgi:hypothetical protein